MCFTDSSKGTCAFVWVTKKTYLIPGSSRTYLLPRLARIKRRMEKWRGVCSRTIRKRRCGCRLLSQCPSAEASAAVGGAVWHPRLLWCGGGGPLSAPQADVAGGLASGLQSCGGQVEPATGTRAQLVHSLLGNRGPPRRRCRTQGQAAQPDGLCVQEYLYRKKKKTHQSRPAED